MFVGKKPLNNAQVPVYPTIKKAGPRFRDAGKHWQVDVGKALYDVHAPGDNPISNGMLDSVILIQNRDYDKQFHYGVSSHKSVVNEEFRPPMQDEYLDKQALSRVPVKINPVRGNINKGNKDFYVSDNNKTGWDPTLDKSLTQAQKHAEWRQNLGIPYDDHLLREGNVLPDLVMKLPVHAADARAVVPAGYTLVTDASQHANNGEFILEYKEPQVAASAGYVSQYTVNGEHRKAEMVLDQIRGLTPGTAGFVTSYTKNGNTGLEDIDFVEKMPNASAFAGYEVGYKVAAADQSRGDYAFRGKLPEVSASSGYAHLFKKDGEVNRDLELIEKPKSAQGVINIQSDYHIDNLNKNVDYVKYTERPNISYTASTESPIKRTTFTENRPKFRQQSEAISKYRGVANQGFVPRSGISHQHVKLRDVKPGRQMPW